MMLNKRRYVRQQIWQDSPLAISGSIATLALAVSCMFLTAGFLSGPIFLLYVPLLAAGLLLASGFYEPHGVARAISWALAWLVVVATGVVVIVGTAVTGKSVWTPILIFGVLVLLLTIAVGISAWQANQSYRQAIAASLDQMLLDLTELRGEVTFAAASEELGVEETAVLQIGQQLQKSNRLTGIIDPINHRLYSLAGLAAKQQQIAGIIQSRGQMQLHLLSEEMKMPEKLLRQWLYQLVRLGHLEGYVDWENGVIYSRQREQLLQQQQCPNCAAKLNLVGQGIIGCQFCLAEIFI